MPSPPASYGNARGGARRSGRRRRTAGSRFRWSALWLNARQRRQLWRAFRRLPLLLRIILAGAAAAVLWLAINWTYQVVRKPSELLFPVSGALYRTPAETWREYSPLFRRHATAVMTPTLLAAIAQVEGSGNPVARTYWRWSWSRQPFEIYRPASSSVGMYQMTDGTFAEARHFCVKDHRVAPDGPWNDWHSCWFNSLYARVVPGDAVELTAAYLDHQVSVILERHGMASLPVARKQQLAALIHLCGAGAGDEFARRGLRLAPGQLCGTEDPRQYLARVQSMQELFDRMASAEAGGTG